MRNLSIVGQTRDYPGDTPETAGCVAQQAILVLDDDLSVRTMMARLLVSHGYQAYIASDITRARSLIESTSVDLVISDVVMPGGSGVDFRREVAVSHPRLPFILISGYSPDWLPTIASSMPQTRFVQKPFAVDAFVNVIRELLSAGDHPTP